MRGRGRGVPRSRRTRSRRSRPPAPADEARRAADQPQDVRSGRRGARDAAVDETRQFPGAPARPDDDRRPRLPAVPVQERLRESAHDDRHAHRVRPRAVVPPLDVARVEAVLRGAAVALDAVHEVEPVAAAGERARSPVDRLDVPPAVPGRDLGLAGQRLHRREPGRHRRRQHDLRPPVVRDPQRGRAGAPPGAAAGEREGDEEKSGRTAHRRAFERTSPVSVARTSPTCRPTQAAPRFVATARPSTRRTAPVATVDFPASSCCTTR